MMKGRDNLVVLSKIQAPQVGTRTLKRRHLLDLISDNMNKKIILLCAGAGYGKTTLLAQLILFKKFSYVYYHLEESDAEPAVFFSYLIAGIKRIFPAFGSRLKHLSHFFNSPDKYLEIIVGTFINEIMAHVDRELYIILEDYHRLGDSTQIDKIIFYLLEHQPAHLHFIITTRTKPLFSLSGFRARDEILELKNQHLRFSRDEIMQFFKEIFAISLKEKEVKRIEEHSEGWPTSLRLMIQSSDYLEGIKSSGYVRRILESYHQTQLNLFNYFAQEIFSRESKEVQRFLIDCSVLEWLNSDLCDAVTNRSDSARILAGLLERNAFLVRTPDRNYRFHNLFKDFLYSRFTDVERERRICRRAGDFYSRRGMLEEALKFYFKAQAYRRAVSIIKKIGFYQIEQGRSGVLNSYIEQIPMSIRNDYPILLKIYAQSLIHLGRSDEAKNNYLRAMKKLRGKKKFRLEYADTMYELGGLSLNQNRFSVAKKWFRKALELCPRGSSLTKAAILNSLGLVYTRIGGKNLLKARTYFERALEMVQKNRYRTLEASILNNWALNEWKRGDLHQSYLKLSRIVKLLKKHFSPHCGAGFFNASRLSLLLGNKEEARTILEDGSKICNAYNDLWSLAAIWKGYAVYYQELNDFKKAKKFIIKALDVYEKLGIIRLVITALNELVKINTSLGELSEAEKNLAAIRWFRKNKDDPDAIPIMLAEANLKTTQNRFDDAEKILKRSLEVARRAEQIFNSFLINLQISKVYYISGKTKKALSALETAVSLSRLKGYEYLLLQELQREKWMLPLLRQHGVEKFYISSIIRKSGFAVHWIDAFLFGSPRILIDDNEVPEDAWKTIKAKKVLFYLLLHRNEKVVFDSLIAAIWPDASHKSARYNLRKARQHIRQAIKKAGIGITDLIAVKKDLYQISPGISVELDIERFQNLVALCKNLKSDDAKLKVYLQKALSIYKQGFAFGWYDPWVEELRRYYQNLYEDCLIMLADFYYRKHKFKDAVGWYKKLLSLNFYNEEYHRRLMLSYVCIGAYQEMERDFKELKKRLKKELRIFPQEETAALYKSLMMRRSK